jgi:putative phosphoribosyl transferase
VTKFANRREAGRALAKLLEAYADQPRTIVLGLPRGGVPVAAEVASALHAPLDVFLVRKLGVPGFEELAMGAIASGGVRVLNNDVIAKAQVSPDAIERVAAIEERELHRREHEYRDDRPPPLVTGHTVILVDDGLATGASMSAAVAALRLRDPSRIVVAVPVGAPQTCQSLESQVDALVCPVQPAGFGAVGAWYDDFAPTTDEEVRELLVNSGN